MRVNLHAHMPHRRTSIHVFERLLCLLWGLKLHVGVALGQVRVDAIHGHVNHLDLPVGGEDLLDVFLKKGNEDNNRHPGALS